MKRMMVALVLLAACKKETPGTPPPMAPALEPEKPVTPEPAIAPTVQNTATEAPNAATPVQLDPAGAELKAKGEHFQATWRFVKPRVGDLFGLELEVKDVNGQPLTEPKIKLDATMPAHGHGMMTEPELKQLGPTRWEAKGLKLHMHGAWQFEVTVEAGGVKEKLIAPYEQAPAAAQ